MAFNDIEMANIKRCMDFFMTKRRPAPFIRDEIDLQYRIWGLDVLISEVRHIDGREIDTPIAKMTLNRSQNHWKLYWMNQANEWVAYPENPIPTFSDAIKVVEEDVNGCFFG